MDICVRCGAKDIHEEYLCEKCYYHMHPKAKEKVSKVKKREPAARHGGYFEATVQIRNVDSALIDFVYARMADEDIHVSRELWHDHGVDFQIDSFRFAQKIGRELQQKFGGLIKTNARIFTRDRVTSKDVYRVTVLFKQFPHGKGEEFDFKGRTYKVISIGTDVFVEDVASKEKKRIMFKELEKSRIF